LVVSWWSFCYLDEEEVKQYLKNVKSTSAEYLILAEPIAECQEANSYNSHDMLLRTTEKYRQIFFESKYDIKMLKYYPAWEYNDFEGEPQAMEAEIVCVLKKY
jgi:arginine/lysine/ornithine decarboxylase